MSSTKEKLIVRAFELFGRNGFHGVGLDRIIDEAGVSKQTFYNHFESKDELVLAVLNHRHEVESEVFSDLMCKLGGETPRGKLYALFDAIEAWTNQPDWLGCIFITAAAEFPLQTDPAHRAAAEHTRAVQENLQYLATLAKARDPELLAQQLTILVEGAIVYRQTTGKPDCVQICRAIAHRLLDEHLPN